MPHKIPSPGSVDRWLNAVLCSPDMSFIHCLLSSDRISDIVICTVRRFRVEVLILCDIHLGRLMLIYQAFDMCTPVKDPDTFMLYITASVSPESGVPSLSCSSPRAMLARYVGFKEDLDAPGWTQWENSVMRFEQPRGAFADLFARMAAWDENRVVVTTTFAFYPSLRSFHGYRRD
jgi:hypothetical protein